VKVTYTANDGQTFESEAQCLIHEAGLAGTGPLVDLSTLLFDHQDVQGADALSYTHVSISPARLILNLLNNIDRVSYLLRQISYLTGPSEP
jgi:hypothetical protein